MMPLPRSRLKATQLIQTKQIKTQAARAIKLTPDYLEKTARPPRSQLKAPPSFDTRALAQAMEAAEKEVTQGTRDPVSVVVTQALRLVEGLRTFAGRVVDQKGDAPEIKFVVTDGVCEGQCFREGDIVTLNQYLSLDEAGAVWLVIAIAEKFLI